MTTGTDTGIRTGTGTGTGRRTAACAPPVTDQNFYFVMADRFQNARRDQRPRRPAARQDRGTSGFDPTGKGWYHGGDLKGLQSKLDYIKSLGTTAIWLTPSFKNKAVQDNNGFPSAGYHGYWITDFTQIDPHLGTNDDLRALIRDAHRRGIKVYFDIITNHTADVIRYQEGAAPAVHARRTSTPYRTAAGTVVRRPRLRGREHLPGARSGRPADVPVSGPLQSYPYRPCVPAVERNVKVPAWLNDVSLYHNRGNTTFVGENSQYGDFFGLDDLFTENPRVVDGMIDIYKTWIRDFRIDGFRMDTMKHVDDAFWQRFAPAIERYARSQGIRDFYMFGEVAEDFSHELLSHYMTHDDVQGVLDFLFQMAAVDFAGKSLATDRLRDLFVDDDWYTDGDSNAYNLPTFLGNHDRGRIGMFLRNANPGASEAELLRATASRTRSCTSRAATPSSTTATSRASPAPAATRTRGRTCSRRKDPSTTTPATTRGQNDNIGSDETPMDDNFDPGHPLYRELAAARRDHPPAPRAARRRAAAPVLVERSGRVRVLAHAVDDREYVVALNNAEVPASASIPTYVADSRWTRVYGVGPERLRSGPRQAPDASRSAPLSAVVYRGEEEDPAQPVGAVDRARRPGDRARPARGPREPRQRRVRRGHVPRAGRPRRLAGHRHGRQRAVPRVPRRLGHRAGHAGAVPRGRARQRAPHALERGAQFGDRAAFDRRSRHRTTGSGCAGRSRSAPRSCPSTRPTSCAFERSVDGGPFTRDRHATRPHRSTRRSTTRRACPTALA